jgi:hypothetical protein
MMTATMVAVTLSTPTCGSAADAPPPALAQMRTLLQGCLKQPSPEAVARLAGLVGATPIAEARVRHVVGKQESVVAPKPADHSVSLRTESTITAFHGWDLPALVGGHLEYLETTDRAANVKTATGEQLTPWSVLVAKECVIEAPAASARAIFELYETLVDQPYGLLVSPDRRQITIFMFDPDKRDAELVLTLKEPVPWLKTAPPDEGMSRLLVPDPRVLDVVTPGVPSVQLTRAGLVAWLDAPGALRFENTVFDAAPTASELAH